MRRCNRCQQLDRTPEGRVRLRKERRERSRTPKARAATRAWIAANPDRRRLSECARKKVYRAIRTGRLIRPDACQECGQSCRAQAAHADYSRPLDVLWLCASCHAVWDHRQPKTLPAGG